MYSAVSFRVNTWYCDKVTMKWLWKIRSIIFSFRSSLEMINYIFEIISVAFTQHQVNQHMQHSLFQSDEICAIFTLVYVLFNWKPCTLPQNWRHVQWEKKRMQTNNNSRSKVKTGFYILHFKYDKCHISFSSKRKFLTVWYKKASRIIIYSYNTVKLLSNRMNFGIFIWVIANLANGYLLNSIPLEKLMQKAMTADKRSEVTTRFQNNHSHGF